MASLLIALIYLAFISLGLPDSLLGAGWPVMHADLGVSLSHMGIISMTISGCTIISSLFSDKMTRRFGTHIVTVTSVFLTATALLGFSLSDKFWMLIVFGIPYGLGAGAIDAALNNYVAVHFAPRHMSWLHCFWGVGTIISPYIMSYALTNSTWNIGYRIVSFVQLGIALVLLCTIPVWKINKEKVADASDVTESIGLAGALRIKGVPQLLIGFFAYCAAEGTTMLWASTYLVEVRGIEEEVAASFGALFYIGLTAGRFLGGFVMNKLGDRRMIRIGTAVLLAGAVCVLLPIGSDIAALAGFVVIGFGCAPIYPCIIHSTPYNFGSDKSGAIIGIQMASAYVGSTFIPPIFGLLSKFLGLGILPIYLVVFFVLMIIMIERTYEITKFSDK